VGLILPAKPEYVVIARLVVAGVARQMRFDEEAVEDIRLAISEACTNIVKHAYDDNSKNGNVIHIECDMGDSQLAIQVSDRGVGLSEDRFNEVCISEPTEGGLGLSIMRALMDDVRYCRDEGQGLRLVLVKSLQ
jgi:serine/threonine-protein kinase RsbW